MSKEVRTNGLEPKRKKQQAVYVSALNVCLKNSLHQLRHERLTFVFAVGTFLVEGDFMCFCTHPGQIVGNIELILLFMQIKMNRNDTFPQIFCV